MEDGGTGTGFVCIHLHMRLPQIVPAHISRIIVNYCSMIFVAETCGYMGKCT